MTTSPKTKPYAVPGAEFRKVLDAAGGKAVSARLGISVRQAGKIGRGEARPRFPVALLCEALYGIPLAQWGFTLVLPPDDVAWLLDAFRRAWDAVGTDRVTFLADLMAADGEAITRAKLRRFMAHVPLRVYWLNPEGEAKMGNLLADSWLDVLAAAIRTGWRVSSDGD